MTGPRVQDCPECDGLGNGLADDYDDEGRITAHRVLCEACAGCGRLADCIECGEPQPYTEAAIHGAFCPACRTSLDVSDREAEERALRRAG